LPSGATEQLVCILEANRPGPFEAQLHVFLDDEGLREIVLQVTGEAKAPAAESSP
jgi:hypothetical protein